MVLQLKMAMNKSLYNLKLNTIAKDTGTRNQQNNIRNRFYTKNMLNNLCAGLHGTLAMQSPMHTKYIARKILKFNVSHVESLNMT